ncbi:ATP-binding protein [Vibrio caribbeanicus]|uniref:histidine kinase n=1 Tax=Vibrio caribbeanicus ATCC BAA-2122 TaxID=796620 RepID=E3BQB9_9VIBR|nr:ATP-binding protein [Vibrio caribbeanicus]EFP94743.1 signal transduction histidine kinase [Vibrio caribbeanicus ATCC BAA-2122]MCY9843153.1 ATP-binding protein [Vibrio caribbeanicus]
MPNKKQFVFKRLSLKSRLVLAAVVWLTAMVIAAGVSVPKRVYNYMVDDTRSQLSVYMDELSAAMEADQNGKLSLTSTLSDPRFNRPYSGLYWSAQTPSDLLRSRSLWDQKISTDGKNTFGARHEKLIYLQTKLYYPDFDAPIEIFVGIDEQPIKNTVRELMNQLWVILALLYFGILLVIMLQVQWSLFPLNRMQKELSQLRKGEKTSLDEYYPKEVAPVVDDLNALVFHYQELLERARHHAGNLSHALKTPLSVLKNEINTLDRDTQKLLATPIEQIQSQIDYHLGRARMAGAKNILSVRANPAERIDAISMAFNKVYAERDLTLINELDSEQEVSVDQTDLDEMLGNLLENAYKWSHSIIRVHAEVLDSDEIKITIEDDGPGIPEDKLSNVLKRGARLDESTPGTGLGLNIVCEMAHSYRGTLDLTRSSMGGLKAQLSLRLAG